MGKRAVLDVIVNRAKASRKSICAVVRSRGQFTWYGRRPMLQYNTKLENMLTQVKETDKVLINEKYFFKKTLRPTWASKLQCRVIGNHKFCKERYDKQDKA